MKLNTFTYEVHETWFGGVTHKFYDIKAATSKTADKRIRDLAGNRSWSVKLINSRPGIDGHWVGEFWRPSKGGAQ